MPENKYLGPQSAGKEILRDSVSVGRGQGKIHFHLYAARRVMDSLRREVKTAQFRPTRKHVSSRKCFLCVIPLTTVIQMDVNLACVLKMGFSDVNSYYNASL